MDFIASPEELEYVVGIKAATLRKYARSGKLYHAEKVCGRWLINATKEWEHLKLERNTNEAKR